jgi:hypothetical protein
MVHIEECERPEWADNLGEDEQGDGRWYRLNKVTLNGITLTAWFMYGAPSRCFVEWCNGEVDTYTYEEDLLMRFGSFGAYHLIWAGNDAQSCPEIVDWFDQYERWGVR